VEGHRYADDAEPSWYSGKSQYDPDVSGAHAAGNPYDSGIHERPSGSFRLPEQRPADPARPADPIGGYAVTDPLISTGGHARAPESPAYDRTSVRGPEYPTIKPGADRAEMPQPTPPMAEPTSLIPPVSRQSEPYGQPLGRQPEPLGRQPEPLGRQPEPLGRQPESVYQTRRPISSVLVAIVMVVLMIPVVRLLLDATFSGDPTSRAIVPAVLLTLGFTLTGIGLFAIARGGPLSRDSWLRPPVAYLPAGLILLMAAGLAVA
jgi:hypothetical protein